MFELSKAYKERGMAGYSELQEREFKLHVITSYSIHYTKLYEIFPEGVEEKLTGKLDCRFFIASEKDTKFGERVILIIEADSDDIDPSIFKVLDKFEIPKKIYAVKKFDTRQNKIQRSKVLEKLGIN